MKIIVYITPQKTVLDPQGVAVEHAMKSLGCDASNVRVGKIIEFEAQGQDTPEFRAFMDKICETLLTKPVIEDYRYEILPS